MAVEEMWWGGIRKKVERGNIGPDRDASVAIVLIRQA